MKRAFQITSFCYVAFALLLATHTLGSLETTSSRNTDQGRVVEPSRPALCDHQRLDNSGETPEDIKERRGDYTIEVWVTSWCGPCRRYKILEVPALLKAGFKVEVLDYDSNEPPEDVKEVPTVKVYYKGTLLRQKTYWKADDIIEYVDNRLSLKG